MFVPVAQNVSRISRPLASCIVGEVWKDCGISHLKAPVSRSFCQQLNGTYTGTARRNTSLKLPSVSSQFIHRRHRQQTLQFCQVILRHFWLLAASALQPMDLQRTHRVLGCEHRARWSSCSTTVNCSLSSTT